MKKYVYFIVIVFSLLLTSVRTATALIVDPSMIASKIAEMVQEITDATTKITQQVGQVKQMASQGFSKDDLFELGKKHATKHGKKLIKEKMKKVVAATKAKNEKKIKAEQESYLKGKELYYNGKVTTMEENIVETEAELTEKQALRDAKKAELVQKEQAYVLSKGTDKELEALDEFSIVQSEYEALVAECDELEKLIETMIKQVDKLKEEQAKIGTSEDKEYMMYEERLKKLQEVKEDETFVNKVSDDAPEELEWSMKSNPDIVNEFSPKEKDYIDFIKRYFYDPAELEGQTGSDARITHQTKNDAITRERRFLLVNTAAHLLQVSATLRREIPVRTEIMDAMFKNTPQTTGELEAISSYSATRVENIKVLLMYAKLQCARLQYMSARELLKLEGHKTPNGKYEDFDLKKYILTTEDVDKLIEKADKVNEAVNNL